MFLYLFKEEFVFIVLCYHFLQIAYIDIYRMPHFCLHRKFVDFNEVIFLYLLFFMSINDNFL